MKPKTMAQIMTEAKALEDRLRSEREERSDGNIPCIDRSEEIAREFHKTYERLAPSFDYRTRDASAVEWKDVPDSNKLLMRATVRDLLNRCIIQ